MERKPYPTDLTDAQWEKIAPLFPSSETEVLLGRPRQIPYREIVNALFYQAKAGGGWRMLPHDLPKWQTVYYYFRIWTLMGLLQEIHDRLRDEVRLKEGRDPAPSAALLDSQSVKTTEKGGVRGYDAGKKVSGRKRHIAVDTIGLLLTVVVTAASVQDRDGAKLVFAKLKETFPQVQHFWADGSYSGQLLAWVADFAGWVLEIVKKPDDQKGFAVLPRRWVVERTFAWLGNYRRLSKDYEYELRSSESMIYLAMIHLMVTRLTKKAKT